jgi:GH15 family glucan-1,4-alpha-glucosidase
MNIQEKSIEIILSNQSPSGAYIASPNFEQYHYCWLRDGSFTAYAMDRVARTDSAARFYKWVDGVMQKESSAIYNLLDKIKNGEPLDGDIYPPTRYTMDGLRAKDDWPNFQLDGYGTWLWGLAEHMRISGDEGLAFEYQNSIKATVDYLKACWEMPNYDCWEENGDKIHTATLACIYGGLKAINEYIHDDGITVVTEEIKNFTRTNCLIDGRLAKYIGSESIDASLLWVAVPFGLFEPQDPIMIKTVAVIEERLLHKGGVHRYPEDTYYGGGEWPLLSAWLGWYYCKVERYSEAEELLKWIERQADENGELPEQVCYHVNDESYIQGWIDKWDSVAKPLVWSHAMYLVLAEELRAANAY